MCIKPHAEPGQHWIFWPDGNTDMREQKII